VGSGVTRGGPDTAATAAAAAGRARLPAVDAQQAPHLPVGTQSGPAVRPCLAGCRRSTTGPAACGQPLFLGGSGTRSVCVKPAGRGTGPVLAPPTPRSGQFNAPNATSRPTHRPCHPLSNVLMGRCHPLCPPRATAESEEDLDRCTQRSPCLQPRLRCGRRLGQPSLAGSVGPKANSAPMPHAIRICAPAMARPGRPRCGRARTATAARPPPYRGADEGVSSAPGRNTAVPGRLSGRGDGGSRGGRRMFGATSGGGCHLCPTSAAKLDGPRGRIWCAARVQL